MRSRELGCLMVLALAAVYPVSPGVAHGALDADIARAREIFNRLAQREPNMGGLPGARPTEPDPGGLPGARPGMPSAPAARPETESSSRARSVKPQKKSPKTDTDKKSGKKSDDQK